MVTTDRSDRASEGENRSGRARRSRGEASRDAILDAAIRVVGRDGLPAASLGAIAREAGTSKPAVLYHFGSRERLLQEMAQRGFRYFRRSVFESADAVPDGQGRARVANEALFAVENRAILAANRELMMLGMRIPAVGAHLRKSMDEVYRTVALLLRRPMNQALPLAQEIVRSLHGHVDVWLCSGEEDPGPYRESALRAVRRVAGTLERHEGSGD